MADQDGRDLTGDWRRLAESLAASAASAAGNSKIPKDIVRVSQRQLELLQEVLERERRLRGDVAGMVTAPLDALFDLMEETGTTLRLQAEAIESAGRALEETAGLMSARQSASSAPSEHCANRLKWPKRRPAQSRRHAKPNPAPRANPPRRNRRPAARVRRQSARWRGPEPGHRIASEHPSGTIQPGPAKVQNWVVGRVPTRQSQGTGFNRGGHHDTRQRQLVRVLRLAGQLRRASESGRHARAGAPLTRAGTAAPSHSSHGRAARGDPLRRRRDEIEVAICQNGAAGRERPLLRGGAPVGDRRRVLPQQSDRGHGRRRADAR